MDDFLFSADVVQLLETGQSQEEKKVIWNAQSFPVENHDENDGRMTKSKTRSNWSGRRCHRN